MLLKVFSTSKLESCGEGTKSREQSREESCLLVLKGAEEGRISTGLAGISPLNPKHQRAPGLATRLQRSPTPAFPLLFLGKEGGRISRVCLSVKLAPARALSVQTGCHELGRSRAYGRQKYLATERSSALGLVGNLATWSEASICHHMTSPSGAGVGQVSVQGPGHQLPG